MSAVPVLRRGEGERIVVLLHGIGGGAETFLPVMEILARAMGGRLGLAAWNMPGYGGTPLDGPMTFPGLADALARLLDELGAARADLVGHSIGGMIALELAATRPERVRSMVLSASTAAFGSRDGTFQEKFVADRLAPLDAGMTMAAVAERVVPSLVGPDPDVDAVALATRAMAAVPPATFRAAIRCLAGFDRRADLERITMPTLIVAGDADANAPARTLARMAERIYGARYACLEETGHLAPLERPAAFAALVRNFLQIVPDAV